MLAITDTAIAAQNAVVAAESLGISVILWKTVRSSEDFCSFLNMCFRQ